MTEPLTFEAWWENHKRLYKAHPELVDEVTLDVIRTSAFLAYHLGQDAGVNRMLKSWMEERGL